MKRLLLAATACALCFSAPALANDYYVEGTAAWSPEGELDVGGTGFDTDDGFLFGAAVGRSFPNNFSVEGEVTYASRDFSNTNADIDALGFFGNGYYNFPTTGPIGAYVGGGIGAVQVGVDGAGVDDDDFVFGGQAMAGLTYQVSEGAQLFTEYRYQAAADADIQGTDVEYNSHNFGGGVRFAF